MSINNGTVGSGQNLGLPSPRLSSNSEENHNLCVIDEASTSKLARKCNTQLLNVIQEDVDENLFTVASGSKVNMGERVTPN